jgi:hypothetical protein
MPNYNIEGNIDFYSSLYTSLDYDSDQEEKSEQNKPQVCEITGLELTNHFVTLECKHTFNYAALYTEICKQKFDFQSYTPDVLSKTDVMKIRDSKLDYYIKCPYCRHIQFELLPYHEDLAFQKKYGVNTCDPDFRVIKTSYVPSTVPSNYTYMLYGYKFAQAKCCKTNLVNGKVVPCWNCYATPIVAPDGTTKQLCPNHVRPEVKAYKLEIKKKEIEAKLLEKAIKKQEALEAKALKKENAKNKATESNAKNAVKSNATSKVKETKEQTEIQDPSLCLNCGCVALLKTGLRKGEACGQKAFESNLCKRHCPK